MVREGEVTYEIDETNGLPEGLSLIDGKVVGTASKLYEDGKNVIVHVTGRNGSKAQLSLNVIVSNEEKKQDNQDGRIVVDEDEKDVYKRQVQQSQSRRDAERQQTQQQLSARVFRHSVYQVLLQIIVRLVLDMVTLVRCYLRRRQSASVS